MECPAGLHHDGALVLVASLSSRLRAGVHPEGLRSCAGLGWGGRTPPCPAPPADGAGGDEGEGEGEGGGSIFEPRGAGPGHLH